MSETDPLVRGENEPSYQPKSSYDDHFSLESPSDEVRFRGCAVRIYSSGTTQFQVVEEEGKKSLKAKISSDGSASLSALRVCYSLVSLLMLVVPLPEGCGTVFGLPPYQPRIRSPSVIALF